MKKSSPSRSISKPAMPAPLVGLTAYFDSRRQTLLRAILRSQRYFAVEGIHDLRVEIKKLRALYSLVAELTPDFKAKTHRRVLRKLFRHAGHLRDIDIEQDLILKALPQFNLSEFFSLLKRRELELRPAFLRAAAKFDRSALPNARREFRQSLASLDPARLQAAMKHHIAHQSAGLRKLGSRRRLGVEELHEVRKRTKALRYLFDIYQSCFGVSRVLAGGVRRLKAVYDSLGSWRDLRLTRDELRAFRQAGNPAALLDRAAYTRFLSATARQLKQHLADFRESWKSLIIVLDKLTVANLRTARVR